MENTVKIYFQFSCLLVMVSCCAYAMRPPCIKLPNSEGIFYAPMNGNEQTQEIHLPLGSHALYQLVVLVGSPGSAREKNECFKNKIVPYYGR